MLNNKIININKAKKKITATNLLSAAIREHVQACDAEQKKAEKPKQESEKSNQRSIEIVSMVQMTDSTLQQAALSKFGILITDIHQGANNPHNQTILDTFFTTLKPINKK